MDAEKIATFSRDLMRSVTRGTALQSIPFGDCISPEYEKKLQESPVLKEYLQNEIGCERDTQIKKAFAAAIIVAKQNNCLPFEIPSSDPVEIAKLVDDALTRIKVAYQTGQGRLDPVEAMDALIDKAAARVTALVDYAFETGLANSWLTNGTVSLLTFLRVPNAQLYRPLISNFISRLEVPLRKTIHKGVNTIVQSAKTVVRKVYSSFANKIKMQVRNLAQ